MATQKAEAEKQIDNTMKSSGSSFERPTFDLGRLENSELVMS